MSPDCYVELVIKLVSCEPPFLQESMLDTPELVGPAKQQLGELEDKSLSDLVHVKGYLCVVCVLKKDDIFTNWSSGSVVGSIALSKL